jgi:hypothetical protein
MMTCRINPFLLGAVLFPGVAPALAGHAGEMESPGLMPHELLIGLVGLGGLVLLALLALAWVVWRVRGLDRRVRDLEGGRKT